MVHLQIGCDVARLVIRNNTQEGGGVMGEVETIVNVRYYGIYKYVLYISKHQHEHTHENKIDFSYFHMCGA